MEAILRFIIQWLGIVVLRFFLWGIILLVWALVVLLISYTFVILFKKK